MRHQASEDGPAVSKKFVPQTTPETEPFWQGCAEGELRLQRCAECQDFFFPPRTLCPKCWSDNVTWEPVSGRGVLHTYLINNQPEPGYEDEGPYAVAIVQLEEGPRMMSNILDIEITPENLVLDMPLEVTFEDRGELTIPQFRPVGAAK